MDIQEHERTAAHAAGKNGGEFLDSIKKYDLRVLSVEEWNTFLEVICMEYKRQLANQPPF